jgi:complex iron-sulfur molybdoenzyme family reductase subunit gamma
MKKLLLILGSFALLLAENILAVKVNGDLVDFSKGKYQTIYVYPETLILDKDSKKEAVQVAVIYNDNKIAFNLKWSDNTKNIQKNNSTNTFGDGVAIQLSTDYSNGSMLPDIAMGSKKKEVIIHFQKASNPLYDPNDTLEKTKTKYQKSFISAGLRTMTEIKDGSSSFSGDLIYKTARWWQFWGDNKIWNSTFIIDLKDDYLDLNSKTFPLAIAIWDGEKKNRAGSKYVSKWILVELTDLSP